MTERAWLSIGCVVLLLAFASCVGTTMPSVGDLCTLVDCTGCTTPGAEIFWDVECVQYREALGITVEDILSLSPDDTDGGPEEDSDGDGGDGGQSEILEVPALGVPTVQSTPLQSGQRYLIEVSDTWAVSASGTRRADAEWINYLEYLGDLTWYENPADVDPSVTHPDLADLLIDGLTVDWLGTTDGVNFAPHTYSPSHVYRYEIVGAGARIEFQIADPGPAQPWDNSGSLFVSITPVP